MPEDAAFSNTKISAKTLLILNGVCFIIGFSSLVISIVAFVACLYYKIPVANFVYDKFLGMITYATILSFVLSKLLYLKAWKEGTGFSEGGNTGKPKGYFTTSFYPLEMFESLHKKCDSGK